MTTDAAFSTPANLGIAVYSNNAEAIGNKPLVRINRLISGDATVLAKVESRRLHAVCACQTSTRTSRLRDTVRRLDAFSAHGRSACQTGGGLLPQAMLALRDTPAAARVSWDSSKTRVLRS